MQDTEAMREKRIILVIDGHLATQFATNVFLQRLNYHVMSVSNAEDALTIIALTTPLLVISETTLPHMSGIDFLSQLKQDPRTRNVPVLIHTAVSGEAHRSLYEAAGCAGYLVHTSDYGMLYKAVQQATEPQPRRFVRLTTWLDVIVKSPGNDDQSALVTTLSEDGMFVVTQNPLPYGTTAEFTLHLSTNINAVKLEGKVLYRDATPGLGENPGMGVKFLQVRPDDGAVIKAFIEKKLIKGLAPERV